MKKFELTSEFKIDLSGRKLFSFYGTIDEFREQIKRTREGKVADEYLKIADLMEYHFKKED